MTNHETTPDTAVSGVVFDFGGVLVDWDPLPAIAAGVGREEAERFLAEFDFMSWNHQQDAGRPWDEALAELERTHPHFLPHGRAYGDNFALSQVREIPGTPSILRELHAAGVPLLGLTNWPHEFFYGYAPEKFEFFHLFPDIVVSGTEKLAKPDPAIYHLAIQRIGLPAEQLAFIDDRQVNIDAAVEVGMHGILFTDAEALRGELATLGLLP